MDERDIARYYDRTDLSSAIEDAEWDDSTDADPMVVTSLRLPKSLLDWVRKQAAGERVRPTTLIRHWIEDRRAAADGSPDITDLAARVDRLESVTLQVARSTSGTEDDGADSMADLLAALQKSVDATHGGNRTESTARRPDNPTSERRRGA